MSKKKQTKTLSRKRKWDIKELPRRFKRQWLKKISKLNPAYELKGLKVVVYKGKTRNGKKSKKRYDQILNLERGN